MDLKICGIVDIVIILGAVIMLILGFKKGFITKILSIASIILILIFSFFFASTLTGYLKEWNIIYPNILDGITNNINNNLRGKEITESMSTVDAVAILLNTPKWIAQLVVNMMGSSVPAEVSGIVNAVAETITKWCCNVISFFIIAFGIILVIGIAKMIASIFRQSKVFKVVDGIFGILLYEVIYIAILSVLFLIVYFLYYKANIPGFNEFIKVDFQMETDSFRLSKWFLENNVLRTLFSMVFGV